jgi:type IV pilus assembly protein PilA
VNIRMSPRTTVRRLRSSTGFTLIELLVVITIIGILAAIAVPSFLSQRQSAWDSTAKSDLANFKIAAASYSLAKNGKYTGMTFAVLTAAPYSFAPSKDDPSSQWTITIVASASYTARVWDENSVSPGTGHRFTFSSATGLVTQN